jgi:hemoglobin
MKATCLFVMLGALSFSLAACAGDSSEGRRPAARMAEEQRPAPKTPLYDRLGGQAGITAVVDAFVARVAADDRINSYFENADLPKLKDRLVEQICQASGGPCKYEGRSMKDVHKSMKITNEAFDALLADLSATLDRFRVTSRDKDQLLALLTPMRNDIVEQP